MAGLAIGARLAERTCRRTSRYLLLYAALEGGLALYLFFSPYIISSASSLFIEFLPALGHETPAAQIARLAVTGSILLPPDDRDGDDSARAYHSDCAPIQTGCFLYGAALRHQHSRSVLGAIITGIYKSRNGVVSMRSINEYNCWDSRNRGI